MRSRALGDRGPAPGAAALRAAALAGPHAPALCCTPVTRSALPPCCAACSWHKEDIDLFSINYLHFGAPKVTATPGGGVRLRLVAEPAAAGMAPAQGRRSKGPAHSLGACAPEPHAAPCACVAPQIWYCVSPRDNPKFEAMAQALYPDLYRSCQGFMRHKVGAGRMLGCGAWTWRRLPLLTEPGLLCRFASTGMLCLDGREKVDGSLTPSHGSPCLAAGHHDFAQGAAAVQRALCNGKAGGGRVHRAQRCCLPRWLQLRVQLRGWAVKGGLGVAESRGVGRLYICTVPPTPIDRRISGTASSAEACAWPCAMYWQKHCSDGHTTAQGPTEADLPARLLALAPAEAVNFAMEEWLDVGCAAVPCTCSCLPDGVALDMGIFLPELRESSSGGCAHSARMNA